MADSAAFPVASDTDRQAVLRRWRSRSRLVRTMRVVLPAVMVAIVVALVGWVTWRNVTERPAIPREGQTEIRLLNARFVGRVKDGRGFTLGARQAIRDDKDYQSVALIEPAMVVGQGEGQARMSARVGNFNERDKLLRLRGDVRIDDGKGLRFTSQEAIIDTTTGEVLGHSQVQGDGPLGQLNAKSYSVEDKGDRLVFRGGVRARVEGR